MRPADDRRDISPRKRLYLIKRIIYMVFVLLGVSLLMFFLVRVLPGDPIALSLGPMADEESIRKMRHELGLDRPIHIQYFNYIRGIGRGEFGISLVENRDVSEIIKEKFPATLELIIVSMLISVILGIPLGVSSALRRNRLTDHSNRVLALFGVSFPQFWLGLMLQLFLGYYLNILPITGRISVAPPKFITGLYLVDSLLTFNLTALGDSLLHILSPAIVLSLGPLANISRLIRANMIDQMSKDYTNMCKAVGMSSHIISYKYMLRNAFSSTLTMIGFLIPLMLGTAFVVEKVFAWPGIARFGADAIIANDFNGVVGVTLLIGVAFVLVNFVVDQLYGILDPRIKLER